MLPDLHTHTSSPPPPPPPSRPSGRGGRRRALRGGRLAAALALGALLVPAPAWAQATGEPHGATLEGVVRDDEGAPLAGVLLRIPALERSELSHDDGTWHFERLPPGTHTVTAERIGYGSAGRTVTVAADEVVEVELVLSPSAIEVQGFVVTGTPEARSSDRILRPVDVLSGQELTRRLEATVAQTLAREPGLATVTMGPAAARPVIRGLGGDRVLMLEDGQRVGDVSAASPDHATAVDPASASRIEVVRGPSALLYGSQALGGVVNVIREEVPRTVHHQLHGDATLQSETVNDGVVASSSLLYGIGEHIGLRAEGGYRTAGDLATPGGDLVNTGITTVNAGAGASWIDEGGHLGGAYRFYGNDYGIPGGFVGAHPRGVDIEMTRHAFRGEGQLRNVGPFSRIDADVIHTRYNHRELEASGVLGTEYGLFTTAGEIQARHGEIGAASGGTVGVRAQFERFGFGGSTGTADTRRWTTSLYAFEEFRFDWLSVEGGVRWDHVEADVLRPDPDASIGNVRDRSFDALSGSVGVLAQPAAGFSVGATVARAFRAPDVNELYSTGPHLASFVFEVGNPDLETEVSTGVDVFARLSRERVSAEVALFHNAIDGYVYARDTGEISRVQLPIWQFTGADVRMIGGEAQLSVAVTDRLLAEATASYVRGTLVDTDAPLPLIPPLNGRAGLRYERTDWFAGAEVRWADRQDRVGAFEVPTAGYAVWGLSAGYRTTLAGRLHSLTLRVDNLTDEIYRNHLARTKEFMPEAGRGLSLVYRVVY